MSKKVILTSDEGSFGLVPCIQALQGGAGALQALEIGIKQVELTHAARTVGYGGAPNILGEMQCDAAVMRGDTLSVGAVGALSGIKHPIAAACALLDRMPHVLLVAEGAKRFALEMGLEQHSLLSEEAERDWHNWLRQNLSSADLVNWPNVALSPLISFKTRSDISRGTVVFLIRDEHDQIFVGVSTSGWAYKYPGRLGDSPIAGAGFYADSRYGAAACTHSGEMTIRAGTARSVVLYIKQGASVEEACREAALDLGDLKDGYIGPVIIHAMDAKGAVFVGSIGDPAGEVFHYWEQGMCVASEARPTRLAAQR